MRGHFRRLVGYGALVLLLASCGGGGGGGGSASPPPPPGTPAIASAVAKDGYVTLSWNAVSGATSYNLYWSLTTGVTTTGGIRLTSVSSPLNHGGLVNGKAYYFVLTAANAGGESAASSQATATPVNGSGTFDPLYGDQWHLKNTGQAGATGTAGIANEDINVEPVLTSCGTGTTCRGEGVRIAVVDDGLEIAHEDLAANIATGQGYNYVTFSSDPTNAPTDMTSGHGTSVAGIVAARDLNDLGVRGVAPRANLVGYNLLQNGLASNEADAMTRGAAAVAVSTNSWGAPDQTGNLFPSDLSWRTAINTGLTTGRGGRGIVYTWAAGNGAVGLSDGTCPTCVVDNSNYDGQANYRGVMAIGAVTDQGTKSSYSERGANLWVSAPGGEFCDAHTITTVDRTGAAGENTGAAGALDYANLSYTKCMNGTSSATPMVAGVAALMLQANPNLGWRDVRAILAATARKNDALDVEWAVNGVGFHFNPNYGFGVVNASSAVVSAQSWTVNLPAEKTYTTTPLSSPNVAIPDNNTTGVSNTITVSGSGITEVEFVEIIFSAADHTYSGDLDITLTSPAGTVSRLAEAHSCLSDACSRYSSWIFGSANFLGEVGDGNWTLTVKDLGLNDIGTFQSWSLKFYGI
jgi:proprotein convertase subtilisin/kexin type 2